MFYVKCITKLKLLGLVAKDFNHRFIVREITFLRKVCLGFLLIYLSMPLLLF